MSSDVLASDEAPLPHQPRGLLFIVSAPSGTGKTTLVERLVHVVPRLRMSRSYTSRTARAGEQDGVDYNFISRDRFESMAAQGEFLEWADVFGNYYGTCAADTDAMLASGEDVVLVIDVQGARQVRSRGIETIGVFVLPPSASTLEGRLRGRSKDSEGRGVSRGPGVRQLRVRRGERYRRVRRGSAARDHPGRARAGAADAVRRGRGHRDVSRGVYITRTSRPAGAAFVKG